MPIVIQLVKRLILTAMFSGYLFSCLSQTSYKAEQELSSVRSLKKLMLGVGSGFEWEFKMSKTITTNIFLGLSAGFSTSKVGISELGNTIIVSPTASVSFKKYYNLAQRLQQGKSIRNNSGNFLFFHNALYLPAKFQTSSHLAFSLGWGMQRSISDRINMELQLGVTHHIFYFDKARGPFSIQHPFSNIFSFSYLLLNLKSTRIGPAVSKASLR